MSDETAESTEEPTQKVINLNINDKRIAAAKEEFKEIDAYIDLDAARAAKKVLTKMRTTLTEAHRREKKQILIDGRRLDGEKNRLLALITEVEDPIAKQLTEIKEKAEREEAARVEKIENEIERIKAFANDRHDLTREQIEERQATLATIEINEEFFAEFTDQAELFKAEAIAKLRIAFAAETERLVEAQKLEDQRKEQEKRQAEMDKQQAELDKQKADQEAEEHARNREAVHQADIKRQLEEQEAAERKAKLDKQAQEQAAERKKIDDENARIAQEAADKEEAERKAKEQAEAEERRLAAAPDVEKLESLATTLEDIRDTRTTMRTEAGSYAMIQAGDDLTATVATIRRLIEEMK